MLVKIFEHFVQNVWNLGRNVENLCQNLEHYKHNILIEISNIIRSNVVRNVEKLGQNLEHYKIFVQMLFEI